MTYCTDIKSGDDATLKAPEGAPESTLTHNDTLHNLKAAARGLAYADAAVDFSPRVDMSESIASLTRRADVVAYVATAFPELRGADLSDVIYSYAGARLQSFVLSAAVAL